MDHGAQEFMRDLGSRWADGAADGAAPDAPPAFEAGALELVRGTMETLRADRAVGPVEDAAAEILAVGPDVPTAAGLAFPRPSEMRPGAARPVPMPWFDHLEGEAADAWREQVSRHCAAVGLLTRELELGMESIVLPGVSTKTAIANCVVYGAGCLIMAGGVGLRGRVRRLAGALMAYMLFDHIGDSLDDRALRRMVHKEMMVFWATGRWSDSPANAVKRVLTPGMREASARSREWVSDGRGPGDRARVDPQLGILAKAIAADCAREATAPAQEPGSADRGDAVDLEALARSLHKNVPAVAFLLFAYLDDPRDLKPRVLHMAGRAAIFAQLFDDLLDRDEDVQQHQDTVVTRLSEREYRRLVRTATLMVAGLIQDVREVAPRATALLDTMETGRVVDSVGAGALLIYLMTRHRNRQAFGEVAADLADLACGTDSPFLVLRAVRGWIAGM